MLTHNNVNYRNLEEQVQKNKEDIAAHYNIDRVLADFGIRIIGQVSTPAELPDPETFEGDYGDAYAVGEQEPYVFYIWTRADVNAGYPNDYWFNIGQLAIVGPQGPQGPIGPQGLTGSSTRWYYTTDASNATGKAEGDMLLTSNGNVYRWSQNQWNPTINIRGPQGPQGLMGLPGAQGLQGPQGPQGEKGDVGGFINIYGIIPNTDQLPTPQSLQNLTVAYLVGEEAPYTLYVQIGDSSATALWTDVGPFNAATLVTVNGIGQNVWDAETKVTRNTQRSTSSAGRTFLYGFSRDDSGYPTDNVYEAGASRTSGHMVRYTGRGTVSTNAPSEAFDAVNLETFNNRTKATEFYDAQFLASYSPIIYDSFSDVFKKARVQNVAVGIQAQALVQTNALGQIIAADPTEDNQVATKKYVDEHSGGGSGGSGKRGFTVSPTSGSMIFTCYKADGTTESIATGFNPVDDATMIAISNSDSISVTSGGAPFYVIYGNTNQMVTLGQWTAQSTTENTYIIPLGDGISVYRSV